MDATLMALGSAVVAFLWQGAVIGVVVALALRAVRADDAQRRHDVALAGALACLVTFVGTLLVQLRTGSPASPVELLLPELATGAALEALLVTSETASVPGWEVLSAWGWLLGCALMALRGIAHWASARSIVRSASTTRTMHWMLVLESLRERLGLRRTPRFLVSERLSSPALIGWWRPAVVVPVAMLTRLSPAQVEAVLAHELAHLHRSDHIVNALLAVTEVLLFFHPVVWRLLREVRKQRELCTDQLALTVIDEPRLLAEALTNLEAQRLQTRAALPARPREGTLMQRIRTILTPKAPRSSRPLGAAPLAVLALATGGLATSASAEAPTTPITSVTTQEDDLPSLQRRLRIAVERGLLTREEMRRVLEALRKVPPVQEPRSKGEKPTPEQQRALRMRYAELEERLKSAVAAGELTREDAQAKLMAARKEMFGRTEQAKEQPAKSPNKQDLRMRYAEAEARIKKGIAAGKISPDQGKARLEALKKELFGTPENKKTAGEGRSNQGELRMRYAQAEERIKKGIAAGKITEAQGKARLEALKKELFGSSESKAPAAETKRRAKKRKDAPEGAKAPAGKSKAPAGKSKAPAGKSKAPAGKSKAPAGKSKLPAERGAPGETV